MDWLNEPAQWDWRDGVLSVAAGAKTDFWRKTHDGGMRDNGHFWHRPIVGDCVVTVKVEGDYQSQYDQAGLMARVDETTWLKTGVEQKDGVPYASVVVTRDWSDWSVVALEHASPVWFRLRRHEVTYELEYSSDGTEFVMLRQAFLTERDSVAVGPMLASPTGDQLRVEFSQLSFGGH